MADHHRERINPFMSDVVADKIVSFLPHTFESIVNNAKINLCFKQVLGRKVEKRGVSKGLKEIREQISIRNISNIIPFEPEELFETKEQTNLGDWSNRATNLLFNDTKDGKHFRNINKILSFQAKLENQEKLSEIQNLISERIGIRYFLPEFIVIILLYLVESSFSLGISIILIGIFLDFLLLTKKENLNEFRIQFKNGKFKNEFIPFLLLIFSYWMYHELVFQYVKLFLNFLANNSEQDSIYFYWNSKTNLQETKLPLTIYLCCLGLPLVIFGVICLFAAYKEMTNYIFMICLLLIELMIMFGPMFTHFWMLIRIFSSGVFPYLLYEFGEEFHENSCFWFGLLMTLVNFPIDLTTFIGMSIGMVYWRRAKGLGQIEFVWYFVILLGYVVIQLFVESELMIYLVWAHLSWKLMYRTGHDERCRNIHTTLFKAFDFVKIR